MPSITNGVTWRHWNCVCADKSKQLRVCAVLFKKQNLGQQATMTRIAMQSDQLIVCTIGKYYSKVISEKKIECPFDMFTRGHARKGETTNSDSEFGRMF